MDERGSRHRHRRCHRARDGPPGRTGERQRDLGGRNGVRAPDRPEPGPRAAHGPARRNGRKRLDRKGQLGERRAARRLVRRRGQRGGPGRGTSPQRERPPRPTSGEPRGSGVPRRAEGGRKRPHGPVAAVSLAPRPPATPLRRHHAVHAERRGVSRVAGRHPVTRGRGAGLQRGTAGPGGALRGPGRTRVAQLDELADGCATRYLVGHPGR